MLEKINISNFFYQNFIFLAALLCGLLNSFHVYTLFENDRFFSQLSTLEREMSFRTEMGLYYSFYKDIAEAENIQQSLTHLLTNNHTEYPSTINALEHFNLYPELILGLLYRTLNQFVELPVECWSINRGDGQSNVESCDGLGVPEHFYVFAVFAFNALIGYCLFYFGYFFSESFLGGLVVISAFFFNHSESTRVMWTPPLRESWGYPLFLFQMLFVTKALNSKFQSAFVWIGTVCLTILFLLSWQFAQFALLTQTLCIFGMYLFQLISKKEAENLVKCFLVAFWISYVLLFGNKMLLISFYGSTLVVFYVILKLDDFLSNKFKSLPALISVFQVILFIFGTFYLRFLLKHHFKCEDDNHIWNLLKAKFSTFRDFHTLLYLCAAEFDFLEFKTILLLCKTLLLPLSLFIAFIILFKAFDEWYRGQQCTYKEEIYLITQTSCFAVMSSLIMRLKLFFTPHLCIILSLLLSKKLFKWPDKTKSFFLIFLLLGLMSIQGLKNIDSQRDIIGEYNNPPLENLLLWVQNNTAPKSAFAGPMGVMANIMLSTGRPIVNHPHYESSEIRKRTLEVYKLFSREPIVQIYQSLKDMGVRYAVIDKNMCQETRRFGCNLVDMWDAEKPKSRFQPPTCQKLMVKPEPFKTVYNQDNFMVLKL